MRLERTQQLIALPYQSIAIYRPIVSVRSNPQPNFSFRSLLAPIPKGQKQKSQKNTLQPPLYFCSNFVQDESSTPRSFTSLLYERPSENYAHLPLSNQTAFRTQCFGKLRRSHQGHYFLDVPKSLLELMRPYMPDDTDLEENAHIGVLIPDEYEKHKLWQHVKEVGKRFYFGIEGFYEVDLIEHQEYARIWGLKITSPSLEALRKKYNLSPKIRGHDFFLIVSAKKRTEAPTPMGTYRIHPGIHPV